MTYQELQAALEIFGLGERATLQKIKDRHRDLVKQHHPDHNKNNTDGMMFKINAAYEILKSYCENYQFCFTETEFLEQLPEERLRRQFGWDPLWGGKKEEDQTD